LSDGRISGKRLKEGLALAGINLHQDSSITVAELVQEVAGQLGENIRFGLTPATPSANALRVEQSSDFCCRSGFNRASAPPEPLPGVPSRRAPSPEPCQPLSSPHCLGHSRAMHSTEATDSLERLSAAAGKATGLCTGIWALLPAGAQGRLRCWCSRATFPLLATQLVARALWCPCLKAGVRSWAGSAWLSW